MTEIAAGSDTVAFGRLEITFDERVLRPRTWTVAQSRWAAAELRSLPEGDVLELCCGAGQIGLLAVADSDRRLVCVDANPIATTYTRHNAEAAGLGDRVTVREGFMADVLEADEVFPMIIADPPWVRRTETIRFPDDPLLAIDGGDDGLSVARECLRTIARHLAPGGVALLQLGTTEQATALATPLEETDLVAKEVREFGDRGVLLHIGRPPDPRASVPPGIEHPCCQHLGVEGLAPG